MTLTLRIRDNGVGIDPEVVEKGKEGPFGLRGMRERAERIGSKFTLVSSPDSGTVLTLVGPGRIAFRSSRPAWAGEYAPTSVVTELAHSSVSGSFSTTEKYSLISTVISVSQNPRRGYVFVCRF